MPDKNIIFFVADGWRRDMLDRLVSEGDLPVIKQTFFDGGFVAKHMITSFPPVSIATHTTMLTGHDCFKHQINSIRYLNRETNKSKSYIGLGTFSINRDLANSSKTLYEFFHDDSDAIFEPLKRGAKRHTKARSFKSTTALKILRKRIESNTLKRITVVWLPSLDIIGHRYGSESIQVNNEMKNIDNALGETLQLLHDKGQLSNTYLLFASDHGQRSVENHFDLRKYFSKCGYSILGKFYQRLWSKYLNYDLTVWSSGHGSAHIYIGKGNNKPKVEEICELLRKQEPVQLISYQKTKTEFIVQSKNGSATIRIKPRINHTFGDYEFSYDVTEGRDPVNFSNTQARQLVNSGFYSGRTWFELTVGSDYPDFMVQLFQALYSPNSGDIIVTAMDGWDFRDSWHKACHGSWYREDMDVPLMISGPGIETNNDISMRTVDLLPTILDLLNVDTKSTFDGQSYARKIQTKQQQQQAKPLQSEHRKISTSLCG